MLDKKVTNNKTFIKYSLIFQNEDLNKQLLWRWNKKQTVCTFRVKVIRCDDRLTLDPTSTLTSTTFPGMGAPTWPLIDFWALGWNFISWVEDKQRLHASICPVIQPATD